MISVFNDLLEMSNEQLDPQRLLFLFAKANESKKKRKRDDKKGTITPTMVVDKLPEDIKDFSSLVNEADSLSKDWDFMFVASLGGEMGKPPTPEDAEPFLNKMTNDVVAGTNIHGYVVFDRQQNPIEMMTN